MQNSAKIAKILQNGFGFNIAKLILQKVKEFDKGLLLENIYIMSKFYNCYFSLFGQQISQNIGPNITKKSQRN